MQYLMVLLVTGGVIVFMVGIVIGISFGLGAFLNSRSGTRPDPANTDPCAQCLADRDWYDELPIWKRNLVTAWWLANRYQCAVKGCK